MKNSKLSLHARTPGRGEQEKRQHHAIRAIGGIKEVGTEKGEGRKKEKSSTKGVWKYTYTFKVDTSAKSSGIKDLGAC